MTLLKCEESNTTTHNNTKTIIGQATKKAYDVVPSILCSVCGQEKKPVFVKDYTDNIIKIGVKCDCGVTY